MAKTFEAQSISEFDWSEVATEIRNGFGPNGEKPTVTIFGSTVYTVTTGRNVQYPINGFGVTIGLKDTITAYFVKKEVYDASLQNTSGETLTGEAIAVTSTATIEGFVTSITVTPYNE